MIEAAAKSGSDIGLGDHCWSEIVGRASAFWVSVGRAESSFLADEISEYRIDRPIFICGLARSGSTILLELLASLESVISHQYQDYPLVFAPVLWSFLRRSMGARQSAPKERAHKDGLVVGPESPEAMEEPIWMHFFPSIHDPSVSNVLDRSASNPQFDAFYRKHIQCLLYLRKGRRYLAKGNYNVARLGYLAKLMPDARFIVPVREPIAHVVSLEKQHRLFCALETRDDRVLAYMRRVGHFEFGLDRRPINFGDSSASRAVLDAWAAGDQIGGLALYWTQVYDYVLRLLQSDPDLARRSMIVRYDELCKDGAKILNEILEFSGLQVPKSVIMDLQARLHLPTYYRISYNAEERNRVHLITDGVANRIGIRS